MKKILILAMMLLLVATVSAEQGHMKLLAVQETDDGYKGSPADLYLEIIPGTGRIFLETFPLLKIDTQISTRFAKEIVCDYLNIDCDNHDFIYTITAESAIIGGPSAGAAIAMLTIAMLEDIEINENIVITGTINSGGIVGSVGGIKEKIDAAGENGISIVIIPEGERFVMENVINGTNQTVRNETDLYEYGKEKNVRVIEAANLDDVMYIFTGKIKEKKSGKLVIDKGYETTMRQLAVDLCDRSKKLKKGLAYEKDEEFNSTLKFALNLTEKGDIAFEDKRYYSSASYCFGANVKLSYLFILSQNLTKEEFSDKISVMEDNIDDFNRVMNKKKIKTITDLEAFMVVKERLIEASDELSAALDDINKNNTEAGFYKSAYASERVHSAYSWFSFFDNRGKRINFNKDSLKTLCQNKLKEAEERYQYVNSFIPQERVDTKKEITLAYQDLINGNYELCLFKASKSKAESDVILSAMYAGDEKVRDVINQKLDVAKKTIIEQIRKGGFPILGYSYYEYANTLNATDKYSSLLYSEYAMELSNLDLYFKDKRKVYNYKLNKEVIAYFIGGIVIGFFAAVIFKRDKKKRRNPSRTRKRALLGKKR